MLKFWHFIIISLIVIAVITIVNSADRNLIILILAIELIFFALSIACIVYHFNNSNHWNNDMLFAGIALTVLAAAESAVALALVARIHKQTKSIRVQKWS